MVSAKLLPEILPFSSVEEVQSSHPSLLRTGCTHQCAKRVLKMKILLGGNINGQDRFCPCGLHSLSRDNIKTGNHISGT